MNTRFGFERCLKGSLLPTSPIKPCFESLATRVGTGQEADVEASTAHVRRRMRRMSLCMRRFSAIRRKKRTRMNASREAADSRLATHRGTVEIADRSQSNVYCLWLAYDGTRFGGWQLQRNSKKVLTVQGEVEKRLMKITQIDRDTLYVQASSRTDAGVHARGQVAHFYTGNKTIDDTRALQLSLNRMLPQDIVILDIREAPRGFSARFHAQEKMYKYYICNKEKVDPFRRNYTLHVWKKLDIDRMKDAAACFIGQHDFSSFANFRENMPKRNPIRRIKCVRIREEDGDIEVEIQGNGFLYKQVRNMVGALLSIGLGKIDKQSISDALDEGETFRRGRRNPPPWNVAPSHGLFLERVFYPGIFE